MRELVVDHCDACGREIINVKPEFVVSERESYAIVACVCCGHHQSIPYKKKEGEESDARKTWS